MPTGKDRGRLLHAARAGQRAIAQPRVLQALSRHGDLALAALIVAVVALLVLPLPTMLLDGLIAINLAASISLLMLSLYVPSALGLSTFPSLLLLTTLFRLSLNIASTKLILLHADAGHVIDTFGRMVVGGNVVVGLVVFLIIAIVQFIVIAKGAERVAEVGARFSLDGMPGKQMSIDADLRAGIIDKTEAHRRRRELEDESQLHGAMDGAMKFVKGDAIAGIIIAFVNIVAGIAIGASMHGMTLSEAVSTYAVLSVGDGMVAQIPSLFVSIAAGIVITRVGGKDNSRKHLGAQIAHQVLGHPHALLLAGAIVATFMLVPGLPFWPFAILAALLASAGYFGQTKRGRGRAFEQAVVPAMTREGSQLPVALIEDSRDSIAVPLRIRISPKLRTVISPPAFDTALSHEKWQISQDLGLPFPGLKMSFDPALTAHQYAIDVQEVQVTQGDLQTGTSPRAEEMLALHLSWAVRRHADAFVGMQEVHTLLARAASQLPDLAAEVQRAVPVQRIAEVMRRLAQEGVSIRYMREICESLLAWGPREKDVVMLTEYVRVDLGRFIARRYIDSRGALRAVVLDAEIEKVMREATQQSAGGSFLALAPETTQALMTGAEAALAPLKFEGPPIVLTSMEVRRYLKRFLDARFPELVVLSYQELPATTQIQAIGRITLQHIQRRVA